MKICIVSKIDSKEPLELAQSLGWALSDKGYEVVYEESVAAELGYEGVSLRNLSADILLVLGGDGSVLRAVRMMNTQIPVLGINQGHVGFLTDLEKENRPQINPRNQKNRNPHEAVYRMQRKRLRPGTKRSSNSNRKTCKNPGLHRISQRKNNRLIPLRWTNHQYTNRLYRLCNECRRTDC